ncbi:MAG: hypothetical protein NQ127_00180 [Candidatus Cardinium sp.]|nr:hypothetical protein [Candidatus Cardinium sp.]
MVSLWCLSTLALGGSCGKPKVTPSTNQQGLPTDDADQKKAYDALKDFSKNIGEKMGNLLRNGGGTDEQMKQMQKQLQQLKEQLQQ